MNTVEDLGSLNPDLYRTTSIDTADPNSTLTFRFELKYSEAKEWMEINIVRVKGVPKGMLELFFR